MLIGVTAIITILGVGVLQLDAQAPVGPITPFDTFTNGTGTSLTLSSFLAVGTNPGASGMIRLPNGGAIVDRNAANNGDLGIFDTTAANVMRIAYTGITTMQTGATSIQIGGNTSAFPMFKRVSTGVSFRLADDSADAPISAVADVTITNQKATTGQRFACLDTNGKIVSSVTACVGT